MSDQPFDKTIYDAVMADKMDHTSGNPSLATEYSDGYNSGYNHAALTAARIAAERVPVSDQELLESFYRARNEFYVATISDDNNACDLAGIRAVRAAIVPQPVIPDWVDAITLHCTEEYEWQVAFLTDADSGDRRRADGFGATRHDALTAACEAARETT